MGSISQTWGVLGQPQPPSFEPLRPVMGVARVYNVWDYGATGNGANDDTAAVQAAINACGAAGGGIVYFPPGTYLISSTLNRHYANVTLMGAGSTATVLKAAATLSGSLLSITYPVDTAVMCAPVRGLTLDGSNAPAGTDGIAYGDATEGFFGDLQIQYFPGAGIHCKNVQPGSAGCERTTFEKAVLYENGIGLWYDGSSGTATSFARQNLLDVALTVQANQIGIQVSGGAFVYHSFIRAYGNIGGTAISIGNSSADNAAIVLSTFAVGAEFFAATTSLAMTAAAKLTGRGYLDFSQGSAKPTPNIAPGAIFSFDGEAWLGDSFTWPGQSILTSAGNQILQPGAKAIVFGSTAGVTLSLPSLASLSTVPGSVECEIINYASVAVTVAAQGADSIDNFGTTGSVTVNPNTALKVLCPAPPAQAVWYVV